MNGAVVDPYAMVDFRQTSAYTSVMPEQYLLLPEVAELARVSVSTVRHWIRVGRLPSVRPGRRRLVPRAALVRLLRVSRSPSERTRKGEP